MATVLIRQMQPDDISAVSKMQHAAWHEYYSQYTELYRLISSSVSLEGLQQDWTEFLNSSSKTKNGLIRGADQKAYVAFIDHEVAGVGAVSAYVEGKWPEVDKILRQSDGTLPKVAKFQELYVASAKRGYGLGHRLTIARADAMLELGYTAIFLTTYAEAQKTIAFHHKNNMTLVHEYMSIQTFAAGQRAKIACFLNTDLRKYRDFIEQDLFKRIEQGRAFKN